jgi:hypothetical protein
MALTNGHGSSPLDLHPNRFLFTSESVGRGHPECVFPPQLTALLTFSSKIAYVNLPRGLC